MKSLDNHIRFSLAACVSASAMSYAVDSILRQYHASSERGFLPKTDPLQALPVEKGHRFGYWDALASALPSLCAHRALSRRIVDRELGSAADSVALVDRLATTAELERACLVLSFVAHAYVWYGSEQECRSLPASICAPWRIVSRKLGRPPILTYYSYNLQVASAHCLLTKLVSAFRCNWRRIDSSRPIELGNICRLINFLGGQDEEWFSVIHIAIEAKGGFALRACAEAHLACANTDADAVADALKCLTTTICELRALLERMEERCDPYIYNERVRRPMSGWTDMRYEDLSRLETYYGETGAQSSLIPAIDAALGLRCDDLGAAAVASKDIDRAAALVPYLQQMRDYMPPSHARLVQDWAPQGALLRQFCFGNQAKCAEVFDSAVEELQQFRKLHLGLAYRFVRQFDERDDDAVIGTGGTAFMPYLRAHQLATAQHKLSALKSKQ